jgi:hypothetical protein
MAQTRKPLGSGLLKQLTLPTRVLLLQTNALAAPISCKFADEKGKLLQSVPARLPRAGTEKHQYEKADKKDQGEFRNLKPQAYEFQAQLNNYESIDRQIDMKGTDQTLDLVMLSIKPKLPSIRMPLQPC